MKYKHRIAFGEIVGFSCAYRIWNEQQLTLKTTSNLNAPVDSSKLHGYALSFFFTIEGEDNIALESYDAAWMNTYLEEIFRNTVIVAYDDPQIDTFRKLEETEACDLRFINAVGCQAFAHILFDDMAPIILETSNNTIKLCDVTVKENGHYQASYTDLT